MKAVIQRVKSASVTVDGQEVACIGAGLLVLVGIGKGDRENDLNWIVEKMINLRIFEKEEGRLDYSLLDIQGDLLLVSQFTLFGDCRKGRRPSFSEAMGSDEARIMFGQFVEAAKKRIANVQTGVFQASMEVALVNDGPVTIILDSKV
ncbi:MAG TPA: D-tyrosyl-tRNA(Tyr) deacylase [Deltaproteobacteria bacterium]|nr:D-tyrosyl-tRNA(Tyr) deacylase [Deltaproteobacteria bacterium]